MTTVNNIADIIRIIREQPEWADQLRGALLGQEILKLPQQFAEFTQLVDRRFRALEADIDQLKSAVGGLQDTVGGLQYTVTGLDGRVTTLQDTVTGLQDTVTTLQDTVTGLDGRVTTLQDTVTGLQDTVTTLQDTVTGLDGRVTTLQDTVNHLQGTTTNMQGTFYEQKIGSNIPSIATQHLSLRRVQTIKGYKTNDEMAFHQMVDNAQDLDIITESEANEVRAADIIIQARSHPGAEPRYAAIEVSVTAGDSDILRARTRASILERISGHETLGAVISAHKDEDREQLAAQHGVTLIAIPE